MIDKQRMLEDLAGIIGHGDVDAGLDTALEFLSRYEGNVVCKLKPQYQRLRAKKLAASGYTYMFIASELDVSPRHVFNLLHHD